MGASVKGLLFSSQGACMRPKLSKLNVLSMKVPLIHSLIHSFFQYLLYAKHCLLEFCFSSKTLILAALQNNLATDIEFHQQHLCGWVYTFSFVVSHSSTHHRQKTNISLWENIPLHMNWGLWSKRKGNSPVHKVTVL